MNNRLKTAFMELIGELGAIPPFGDSGYLARYRLEGETVVILALRHQREAGFI